MNSLRQGLLVVLAFASGCGGEAATPDHFGSDLRAVLWMQRSVEYRAACQQTYDAARRALPHALEQTTLSAAVEQSDDASDKPPAVIVDVDETVLDNTPYNARLLRDGGEFTLPSWNAWVEERKAHLIPGAKAFLDTCAELGITVFYVTNRAPEVEAATRDNLAGWELPLGDPHVDTLRMRNEYDDAASEKSPRRRAIAKDYRIVMLLGDDFGDFVPNGRSMSLEERENARVMYAAMWGRRWFALPNPVYGSWWRKVEGDAFGKLVTAD